MRSIEWLSCRWLRDP